MCAQPSKLDKVGHLADIDGEHDFLNDVWGYVDDDGCEYALVGRRNRTDVVDVSTDPGAPTVVASVPGPTSYWRDIKVHDTYAYIVHNHVERGDNRGMQIVDLRIPSEARVVATYRTEFECAQNIFVADAILYACEVATENGVKPLVLFDLADPVAPVEIGVYDEEAIHDVYVRDEVAYAAATTLPGVVILDVTRKSAPVELSRIRTPEDLGHNTWLSEDGRTLFVTNEGWGGHLRIYDVTDPAAAFQIGEYRPAPSEAIVHNVYVRGDFVYLAYYTAGVIVLDVSDPTAPREVATYETNDASFADPYHGVWGLYPFFPSGRLVASDIERGVFLLELVADT